MADADLLQMQQDAIRRVRMMQQKAQRTMEDSTPKSTGTSSSGLAASPITSSCWTGECSRRSSGERNTVSDTPTGNLEYGE